MEIRGNAWKSIAIRENPWNSVQIYGIPWKSIYRNRSNIYWASIEHLSNICRTSIEHWSNISNIYRTSVENVSNIYRKSMDSIEIHRNPWASMEVHGNLSVMYWSSIEIRSSNYGQSFEHLPANYLGVLIIYRKSTGNLAGVPPRCVFNASRHLFHAWVTIPQVRGYGTMQMQIYGEHPSTQEKSIVCYSQQQCWGAMARRFYAWSCAVELWP